MWQRIQRFLWRPPAPRGELRSDPISRVCDPETIDRIKRVCDSNVIEDIIQACEVAGVAFGIVHEGNWLYAKGVGELNPLGKERTPPDEHSLFTLCSISKTLVTAALGILVEEGALDWTDPVGKHLPNEFSPKDKRIATEATFNDFLRHSGGLSNPVVTILGPEGKVLVPAEDFMSVVNDAPTDYEGEPYFDREFMYSNIAYGLMALVIEKVSGVGFAKFVQEKILDPLGMADTAVFKEALSNNENVAHAYAHLEDGTWAITKHDWTSETNSPILAMVGIRSSVNDMMIFSAAVMEAYLGKLGLSDFGILSHVRHNPLKQMGSILNGHYWTRPHDDPFGNEAAYHLGWVRATMPTCMVSWGSWNDLLGDNAQPEHRKFRNDNILGRESGRRLLYKATGIGFCGTGSVNLFPETRSAVVVFSNGLNCGDAADFVASVLIQALFNLQPEIDMLAVAKKERELRKAQFQHIMDDLEKHRDGDADARPEPSPDDYIGRYHGLGIELVIRRGNEPKKMQLCFNSREDIILPLEYHNVDQYSYWPKTRDDWLKGGWLDWDYYLVGILTFKRDESGAVGGLTWVWEEPAEPFFFVKMIQ